MGGRKGGRKRIKRKKEGRREGGRGERGRSKERAVGEKKCSFLRVKIIVFKKITLKGNIILFKILENLRSN